MTRNIVLIASMMLFFWHAEAQQDNNVKEVRFTSLTRGYQKEIVITKDSVHVMITGRETRSDHRKLKSSEWEKLLKCIKQIRLEELPKLESPTMRRAHDGALHSSITISTPGNEWSHSFDDEDPHVKLRELLKAIKAIGEKQK